jgi:hypothetical protein
VCKTAFTCLPSQVLLFYCLCLVNAFINAMHSSCIPLAALLRAYQQPARGVG